jgi:hypothetical protein
MRLERQISKMPARLIDGLIAKARCAVAYDEDCLPEADDPLAVFGASIVRDLIKMTQAPSIAA